MLPTNTRALFALLLLLSAANPVKLANAREARAIITTTRPARAHPAAATNELTWGSGGDLLYNAGTRPVNLKAWRWVKGDLEEHGKISNADGSELSIWVGKDRCVFESKDHRLVIKETSSGRVLKDWPIDKGWCLGAMRLSRTGRFLAVSLSEDFVSPQADYDEDHLRVRIGVLNLKTAEMTWCQPLKRADNTGEMDCPAVPSDDGQRVCVIGWCNGLAVVQVSTDALLWQGRPEREVGVQDGAFSPDGRVIYCGGGEGRLYALEALSGKVLYSWFANDMRQPVYGRRITSIAVSPDGAYVAAGTGPDGMTYIADAKGVLVKVVRHGSTIAATMFSPDSKSLATAGRKQIKIWPIGE